MKFAGILSLSVALALSSVAQARPAVTSPLDATNETISYNLSRRWDNPFPASNDDWYRAMCRGRTLIDAIRETDWVAAHRFLPPPPHMTVQSPFRNFPQEFDDWGWSFYNGAELSPQNGRFDHDGWGVADALRGMKVSDKVVGVDDGKINVAWVHHGPAFGIDDPDYEHQEVKGKPYKHNGKEYKYTDAYYQYGIDEDEGGNYSSPQSEAPEYTVDWPKYELPELRRASDMMYGLCKSYLEGAKADTLRYVMVVQITNEKTKSLIVRAVGDGEIAEWPGKFFGMGETDKLNEPALALLGSPTSAPIAYMLIQHKDDFKDLRVVGVRVFLSNNRIRKACLLWYLKGPVPSPPGFGQDANGELHNVTQQG